MARLLALDQASRTSGYAVFIDGVLEHYGKFTFDDDNLGERLFKIREKVSSLIADYDINEIIIEDIQLQQNVHNNVQTFKALAEVFGVIYELATELQIPNRAVLAKVWKSKIGIKGADRASQKRNAQKYVQNTYNIKATQDESDAICIGAYATGAQGLKIDNIDEDFNWS